MLANLYDMLTYARPHGTATEREFIARFILPLGARADEHGNYHLTIGDPATTDVLFSSHMDTVHRCEGRQRIRVDSTGRISLHRRSKRKQSCLGADDTVGVYLMRQMIKSAIPGHYVFHYGEESGCIGSRALAEDNPERLLNFRIALAFDRAGTADIITHQCGRRTASDAFAASLAAQLNSHGLTTTASAFGVYTDTNEYASLISECSNLSVGYYRQHSPEEYIDGPYVEQLTRALCSLDPAKLISARDVSLDDDDLYDVYYGSRFSSSALYIPGSHVSPATRYVWDDDEEGYIDLHADTTLPVVTRDVPIWDRDMPDLPDLPDHIIDKRRDYDRSVYLDSAYAEAQAELAEMLARHERYNR